VDAILNVLPDFSAGLEIRTLRAGVVVNLEKLVRSIFLLS